MTSQDKLAITLIVVIGVLLFIMGYRVGVLVATPPYNPSYHVTAPKNPLLREA